MPRMPVLAAGLIAFLMHHLSDCRLGATLVQLYVSGKPYILGKGQANLTQYRAACLQLYIVAYFGVRSRSVEYSQLESQKELDAA